MCEEFADRLTCQCKSSQLGERALAVVSLLFAEAAFASKNGPKTRK